MGDINRLLDDYKDDGIQDSEGVFTVNFAKAREKLSKFQLPNPHLLFLKLVQAANLAAQEIQFKTKSRLEVRFLNWTPDASLSQIASKLSSANLQGDNQPVTHMVTALSSLMGICQTPITLTYDCAKTQTRQQLKIDESLEQSEAPHDIRYSELLLESEMPAALLEPYLTELLITRCALYSVPIYFNGRKVQGELPQTSGARRSQYFTTNKVLASQTWSPTPERPESWLPSIPRVKAKKAPQAAWLSLTVDFDPKAMIWLSQAGVLVECRALAVKYPGISGVVCANGLSTDLTGLQFLNGEEMDGLKTWIRQQVAPLRESALNDLRGLKAQGQPASPNAHVKHQHSTIGGMVGVCGFLITQTFFAPREAVVFTTLNFFAWCIAATLVMSFLMWRRGGAPDPRSDEKAAQFIENALK